MVNPPIMRGSTILFDTMDELRAASSEWYKRPSYGRHGSDVTFQFEREIAALEGGYGGIAVSSGTAALSSALSAFVKTGDHILVIDSVYQPSRAFCDNHLRRFGVEITYYSANSDLSTLIQPNTKVIYCEAPGSQTFEMQDIPAIVSLARSRNIKVIMDNTWATPLYFKAIEKGVDVSIHAATKYIVGHSDALLGILVANEESYLPLRKEVALYGHHAAPDDIYLAQRGLRTMAIRLRQHQESAMKIAQWLQEQPQVKSVLFPALPDFDGHDIWKRDFTGATGLLSFELKEQYGAKEADNFVNALKLFGIGFSWGGYESLAMSLNMDALRSAKKWQGGQLVRLHIGLECVEDLQADLACSFKKLQA